MRSGPLMLLALLCGCWDEDAPPDTCGEDEFRTIDGDCAADTGGGGDDHDVVPLDTGWDLVDEDGDGDGYAYDVDCDDADPAVNPGAAEACNGLDDDCDGEVDEDVGVFSYVDSDDDGFGVESDRIEGCDVPAGYSADAGDCDDSDPTTYPGAEEICDGIDHDCDGEADDGC